MKKGLIMLALLMVPVAVSAQVPSNTEIIAANAGAKSDVESSMKLNESIKNVTNGYYVEGIEVTCSNNKYVHTIMNNQNIKTDLTCTNGNTAPYLEMIGEGISSVPLGSDCNTSEKLYASRLYNFDCRYTGNKDNNPKRQSNINSNISSPIGVAIAPALSGN